MTERRHPEEKEILETIELVTTHSRALEDLEGEVNIRTELEDRVREVWAERRHGREENVLNIFDRMDKSMPSAVICSYASMAASHHLSDRGKGLSIAALGLGGTEATDHVRRSVLINLVAVDIWFLTNRRETRIPILLLEEAIREVPGGPDAWSPYVNLMEIKLTAAGDGPDLETAVGEVDALFAKLHEEWDRLLGESDAWAKDVTYVKYCAVNAGLEAYRSAKGGSLFETRFRSVLGS